MKQSNIYKDIKESVLRNFEFLKNYGFNAFSENQLAYEFHFVTENDYISIDIWFESISSTPIWIKVNQFYLENLEPENLTIRDCEKKRIEKYDKLFQSYLKTDDSIYLKKIQESYEDGGVDINEKYLKESSEIIERNIEILFGNLELLKLNTESILKKNEEQKSRKRIEKKIYTLEYQFFPNGDIDDAYEEFPSLEELKLFLNERDEISRYRILDWNMEIVKVVE